MRGPEGMHCRLIGLSNCFFIYIFYYDTFPTGFDFGTPSYQDYDELFYDDYSDDLEPSIAGDLGFNRRAMTPLHFQNFFLSDKNQHFVKTSVLQLFLEILCKRWSDLLNVATKRTLQCNFKSEFS